MSNLDLNNLPPDLQATLSKKETDGERRVRLIKDLLVFILAWLVSLVAFCWSGWIMMHADAPMESRRAAEAILTAIVGGLIGYLVKK